MTELVDGRQAANIGMVPYENMTRSSSAVTYDDLIAYSAVMPDMSMGEEGAIIPNRGFRSLSCAGMNTDKFPDRIPVANLRIGHCSLHIF